MGQSPDELRREIENLRGELSTLVEAVGERVSPKKVVRRSANSVGSGVRSVTDSLMGTAGEATDTVRSRTRRVTKQAQAKLSGSAPSSPSRSPRRSSGSGQPNRAAVGLVALGAGMLAASLLPPSQAEVDALAEVKAGATRLRDELTESGKSMVSELQPELERSKDVLVAKGQRSGARVAKGAVKSGERVQRQAKTGAQRAKTQTKSAARRAS